MSDDGFSRRDVVFLLSAIAVVFTGGTVGFALILDESWHAALYRTIVTASLTGLDTTPRGIAAEALTIGVVLSGVAIFGYFAAQLFDEIAHGVLGGAWREKRRRRMIEQLRDHIIVCGYGRVGQRAAEEFRAAGVRYVVLDNSEIALTAAEENGDLFLSGDGTKDDDLSRAGLETARGLIVASDDDADNLYIALSARSRRPDLTIVARASSDDAERKLKLAGADRVVLPYATAGQVMANLVLKPQVTAFLDAVTTATGPDLQLAEIEVRGTCAAAGRTIRALRIRHETGAIVIALRKADGSFDTTPEPDTPIEVGDVLIGVGSPDEIRALEDLFAAGETVAG